MPTLKEILEDDLGVSSGSEKVASAEKPGTDEIEKLAMEIGLFGNAEPANAAPAAPAKEETQKVASESPGEVNKQTKEAHMGLDSLYDNLFPEDSGMVGSEKTAELEKRAYEEKLGSRAFDHFAKRWDSRVEKLAAEMAGSATVAAEVASPSGGNPHGDSQPGQRQLNNRPADASKAIDTSPEVTDVVKPQSGDEVVGDEKAQQMKAAALRKHLLLSQLEE